MTHRWFSWLSNLNQTYGRTMSRLAKVETFGAFLFMIAFFSAGWAFAWNAHIVGLWLENLFGLGPYDADSLGKIEWRRMWSTAIFLPGIIFAAINYSLNLRDKRRQKKMRWR